MKRIGLAILAFAMFFTMPAISAYAYTNDTDWYDDYWYGEDSSYTLDDQPYVLGKTITGTAGTINMTVGATQDLRSSFLFTDEEKEIQVSGALQWSSNNTAVASVSSDGVVTAGRAGTATISVTYYDNRANHITQKMIVKVTAATQATVSYSLHLSEGKTVNLKELLFPDGSGIGAEDTIAWDSSRPDILTVDQNGVAMAERFGTGKITATHTDAAGNAETRTVTIKISSSTHTLEASVITLKPGDTLDIVSFLYPNYTGSNYGEISCTSSNAGVVSVSGNTITANGTGSCNVTAVLTNNRVTGQEDERHQFIVNVLS